VIKFTILYNTISPIYRYECLDPVFHERFIFRVPIGVAGGAEGGGGSGSGDLSLCCKVMDRDTLSSDDEIGDTSRLNLSFLYLYLTFPPPSLHLNLSFLYLYLAFPPPSLHHPPPSLHLTLPQHITRFRLLLSPLIITGRTEIDLELRLLSRVWQRLGVARAGGASRSATRASQRAASSEW